MNESLKKEIIKAKEDFETGRFDGDIFWYNHMVFEDIVPIQKKLFNATSKHILVIEDEQYYVVLDVQSVNELGKSIYLKYKNNLSPLKNRFNSFAKDANKKLSILTNSKRFDAKKYENFAKSISVFGSSVLNTFEGLEKYITKEAEKTIKNREKLSLLITPLYESYISKNENELIKISKKIPEKEFAMLKKGEKNIKKYKILKKLLKKHAKAWGWCHNNYGSHKLYDENDFLNELIELIGNIEQKQKNIKEMNIERKQKINILKKSDKKTKQIINAIDDLYELRDKRKEFWIKTVVPVKDWLKKIAKQNGYSYEQLKWLTWKEHIKLLKNRDKKVLLNIPERKKALVLVLGYINDCRILQGHEAEGIKKIILKTEKQNLLRGCPVNKGYAKGTVQTINSKSEFSKFKKGFILVTSHTTPDFLPIMKKAKAILTERGGITSHASIVSRELNVPCIVGIKDLTGNLKDGDEVEVDAEKGIVKILKRN